MYILYIYINKKVYQSNNHNFENFTMVLFCYQNDLNINTTESWLIFILGRYYVIPSSNENKWQGG